MSNLHRHNGLKEAHSILHNYMLDLQLEFNRTPRSILGGRTSRHRELVIMSNTLTELGRRLVSHGAKIVAEGVAK